MKKRRIMRDASVLIAHSRVRECGHLRKQSGRAFNDVHRQGRSGSFTQSHREIEQRLLANEINQCRMSCSAERCPLNK